MAAWTLYRRLGDCLPEPSVYWRRALICFAFATPLVSIRNPELFEALVLANALGFTTIFMRNSDVRTFARELLVLCLPLAAVGLPQDVGRLVMPYFARHQGMLLGLSLLVCLAAMRRFRAPFGLAGAVAMTVLAAFVRPNLPLHAYVEVAVLFLLTHSLAWPKGATGATFLRAIAGLVWFADAAVWVHDYPWRTDVSVTAAALILLGAWFAIWRVAQERPDLTIVIAATAVSFCAPTDWLLRQGSPGLVALVSSAFLFAIGFAVAWTRHRWETKTQP